MKRVHFFIYDELDQQINEAIIRWGFNSRSEFFRYLAMDFLRGEKELKTTDEVLENHTKAIRMIKRAQGKTFRSPY